MSLRREKKSCACPNVLDCVTSLVCLVLDLERLIYLDYFCCIFCGDCLNSTELLRDSSVACVVDVTSKHGVHDSETHALTGLDLPVTTVGGQLLIESIFLLSENIIKQQETMGVSCGFHIFVSQFQYLGNPCGIQSRCLGGHSPARAYIYHVEYY